MNKISGVIITYNEESNIRRCLESLQGIVDEIIVVDSFSTDKTQEICNEFDVRFVENPFKGHIEQKNFAKNLSTYEYVLSLDADEALDHHLKQKIVEVKKSLNKDGYFFNRMTNYCGKWIRHSGWYPDKKLRLFNKNKANWAGMNPHDIIEMKADSSIGYLSGDLLHYSYPTVESHINQTNKFTTISAQALLKRGKRSSLFKIITRPQIKFLRDYILKRGFLDGKAGIIICSINALSAFLKYTKLYLLDRKNQL